MVPFLFWNLFRKPLLDRVVRLAQTHAVDFLMLAECVIDPLEIEESLRRTVDASFSLIASSGGKTQLYTRRLGSSITEEFNDPFGGLTIWRVAVGAPPGIMMAVVHCPSRVSWDKDDQALQMTSLVKDIEHTEDKLEHRRTILVGDLNMNPFDVGIVGSQALHAVMTRQLARREVRRVMGKSYRFFYNPMWSFFGDRTPGPAGTYYHRASNPGNLFWNIYDQVLLRPDLMDDLVDLQILTNDGETDLVTQSGLPKESDCSDHLPILFTMNLGTEG
jgi:exonuclease III